jgi:hypothetical protein
LDELTQERIARNQATFRDANERIVAAAGEIGLEPRGVPFICECADVTCTKVLLIDLPEYAAVRRNPRRFIHAPGHEDEASIVVEVHRGYAVVEKQSRAGDVAEQLAGS